jgi:hypothetical protein
MSAEVILEQLSRVMLPCLLLLLGIVVIVRLYGVINMNERIKLLARQADPGYTGNDLDGLGASLVGNDAIERFAQLIVSECCDFLKDTLDDQFAAEQLAEHFEFDN